MVIKREVISELIGAWKSFDEVLISLRVTRDISVCDFNYDSASSGLNVGIGPFVDVLAVK